MTPRSLERRLAALESARTPDGGMYVVDIGDGYVDWHGERIPIDDWQRCHPDAITVDIGGSTTKAIDIINSFSGTTADT